MARRRRPDPAPPPTLDDPPPTELLAGACIEVWCPSSEPGDSLDAGLRAWRRHADARRAWLAARGFPWPKPPPPGLPLGLRGAGSPWSFEWLELTDPERLADMLCLRDLPPSWRPSPVPPQ